MGAVTGINALKRTIELVLQKLNMVQDEMNELSREELIEIMGNNDLDLSWIASQESVNSIQEKIDNLKLQVESCITRLDTIGPVVDPGWGLDVGTMADLNKLIYIEDTDANTVTITAASNDSFETGDDLIIHDYYRTGTGNISKTVIGGNMFCKNISSLSFGDKVTVATLGPESILLNYLNIHPLLKRIHFGKSMEYHNNLSNLFKGCTNIEYMVLPRFRAMDNSALNLFNGCINLKYIEFRLFMSDNYMGADANSMFKDCSSLTEIKFSDSFAVSPYTHSMFENCTSLTALDLTNWILNRGILNQNKPYDMSRMFAGCTNLKEILVSRDKWVMHDDYNITDMFKDCGVDHVTYVD